MNRPTAAAARPTEGSAPAASAPRAIPSRARLELGMMAALWHRDMLRLAREPSRWLGVVAQPLLFWLILGSGMGESFRPAGQAGVSYMSYFFPGVVVMVVLFTAIFATMAVIDDRHAGFLQQVITAPGSRLSLALGKLAGVTTIALLQAGLLAAMAPLAGLPYAGVRWGLLLAAVLLTCVGFTGVTFAMAWRLDSTQAYHAVMSMILLPLWVVSGALFPPSGSVVIGAAMRANPMFYAVEAIRAGLGGTSPGAPATSLALGVLGGLAAIGLLLAARASRRPALS